MPHRRVPRWLFRHRSGVARVVATAGIIAVAYGLIVVQGRVNRIEAARTAEVEAKYDTCVRSRPLLILINDTFETKLRIKLGLPVPSVKECERRRDQELNE